jgi:HAD superfamily phosphoserine phosphatase-like hydrolase
MVVSRVSHSTRSPFTTVATDVPIRKVLMTPDYETVFTDVDDTIIRGKSLFGFLDHIAGRERVLEEILGLLSRGIPRSIVNATYYERVLTGVPVREVTAASAGWFESASRAPGFLKRGVVDFLREQALRGARLVLLTGSFAELVAGLERHLGPFHVIGAPLECRNGTYTGKLSDAPTIGYGKAKALRKYAAEYNLQLDRCLGLGDDTSDLEFMELLGTQAIPSDAAPGMLARARSAGWRIVDVD